MELEEVIDKYRGQKKQIRYGLIVLVSLVPVMNTWFSEGDGIEAQRVQLESDVTAERAKYEAAKQKIAELPALEAKLSEIESELRKAQEILPEKIAIDSVLASLGGLEQEYRVKIVNFKPGQEVQPNPDLEYQEVPIDLQLRGDFSATMRFLDRLVHMPNLTHIRDIKFAVQGERKSFENPVLESDAKLILFKGK